ncbi:MAG: LytR/AlgR family response regulator transcription factor [Saprospiraceae bacterium]
MTQFQRLRNYFNEPEETDFDFRESWSNSVIISIAVTLLVYLFFMIGINLNVATKVIYSSAFGLITFIISFLNDIIFPKLFPQWFNEQRWTLGNNILFILWNFLTITAANLAFLIYMNWASLSLFNFLQTLLITFGIGILPVVLVSLFRHNQKLKSRLKEAVLLNQHIQPSVAQISNQPSTARQVTVSSKTNSIQLSSNQQQIEIDLSKFLYATSEKNYLRIVLLSKEDLLIRNTIKNLEKELTHQNHIIRCHRAFIVNTQQVTNVSGNAQGYKLTLDGTEIIIPVSRSYIPRVKEIIL